MTKSREARATDVYPPSLQDFTHTAGSDHYEVAIFDRRFLNIQIRHLRLQYFARALMPTEGVVFVMVSIT